MPKQLLFNTFTSTRPMVLELDNNNFHVPYNTSFNFGTIYEIVVKVAFSNVASDYYHSIIGNDAWNTGSGFLLWYRNDRLYFNKAGIEDFFGDFTPTVNTFYEIRVVSDGTNTSLLVDGVSIASTTAIQPEFSNRTMNIGSSHNGDGTGFNDHMKGKFREVKLINNGSLIFHFDSYTETTNDQSGNNNHAVLDGGVWIEEAMVSPIPPASQAEYYLYFYKDGANQGGFLKLPAITFNRVVMDFTLEAGGNATEFFDARGSGPHMTRNATSGLVSFGNSQAVALVNGVSHIGTTVIPLSERTVLDVTYPSWYTDDVNVFSYNQSGQYTHSGKLYDLKFYNGDNLVVHYNPTINPTQDLSENGNHPTYTNTVFRISEDKPLSYLSLNGTSDYIKTPNITFTKVEIDFYSRHENINNRWYGIISTSGGTNGMFAFQSTIPSGRSNGYVTPHIKDKVLSTKSNVFPVATQGRYEIQLDTIAPISGEQYLFSLSGTTDFYDADVYSIKFYNGSSMIAHYDTSTGSLQDQSGNGNHATLTGGTWVNETPSLTYLQMDGVDDYFYSNRNDLTVDKVEMEFLIEPHTTNSGYFDMAFQWGRREGNGNDIYSNNWSTVICDGVIGATNTNFIPDNQRVTVTWEGGKSTGFFVCFTNGNRNTLYMKGRIYQVKLYNENSIVAHYDMSTGTVQDVSGNGNHATLVGGTWVTE